MTKTPGLCARLCAMCARQCCSSTLNKALQSHELAASKPPSVLLHEEHDTEQLQVRREGRTVL